MQTYLGIEIKYNLDCHVYTFTVNGKFHETATLEEAKLTIKEFN